MNRGRFHEVLGAVLPERPHASVEVSAVPGSWTAADADAFAVFAEANRRTESGGAATFSTLRTTAGADHRASFGVAQLSIREHLSRLSRESDVRLIDLGTSRVEVNGMRARGDAACAFYHLIVDGRERAASTSVIGVDRSAADQITRLAEAHDTHGLDALIGSQFERATGLPRTAIGELVSTRALRDPSMRGAFAAQYEHDHGVAFDPAHRDGARMAETVRHLRLAHPELDRAITLLGGDDAAATSLGHYLGVGDSAENLLGWHARAASSACGEGRFASLLASIDETTSRAREIENFEHALAAVANVTDLHGEARVETLARIGRIFHGAPTRARDGLFVDGRFDVPRCQSRAELDSLLDEMRSGRTWSDARLAERVAEVIAERSAT